MGSTMWGNMRVGHFWQRTVLRRAAQRYADQGWRVLPGAALINDRYVCGPLCPTVACHPAVDSWEAVATSDSADVDNWWGDLPFSVLLATGGTFDVIDVPARFGAAAARVNSRGSGPVAVSPAGRWMFFVGSGAMLRPELSAQLDVVLHGADSWVPAPPTRTPAGRIRWEISPSSVDLRLPDAHAVQNVLVSALRPSGPPPTFATTTARLGRAVA
jgi:Bifunctional DNA primase/polymerase, N-terminal